MTGTGDRLAVALPLAGPTQLRAWLAEQLRTHTGRTVATVGLVGVSAAAGLVGPAVLGALVDTLTDAASGVGRIDALALWFLAALLVQAVVVLIARTLGAQIGEAVLAHTREQFLHRVLALPLSTVERVDGGALVSRATSDIETLDEGVRHALPEVLAATVTLVLTVVAMLLVAPLLSLVTLLTLPALVLLVRWYRPRAVRAYAAQLGAWDTVQGSVGETATGAASVAALGIGERRLAVHERSLDGARRATRHAVDLQTRFFTGLELGVFLPLAALLLVATPALQNGLVGLGEVAAMALYIERLADPLADLLSWLDELQLGAAALRRTLGVGLLEPDRPAGSAAAPGADGPPPEVALREVRFRYGDGREVLRGLDLLVPAGRLTVVVGPSGAGKTTLGRLIAGLHRPSTGSVCVGGRDVTGLAAADLRRTVVMVTQEHHVFDGTLRENLALPEPPAGAPPWSDDDLWAALTAVGADGWVRGLVAGLDAPLDGDQVAAADAQRLALARVVLADPAVVVLDEATAALDERSARGAERSLAAALAGRTVIAVSHHLDIAAVADLVVVVDDGRVVEQGRHPELVAAGAAYTRLWNSRAGTGPDVEGEEQQDG